MGCHPRRRRKQVRSPHRVLHRLPSRRQKSDSIGGAEVESIARDTRGCLWFGTTESGLDRFDPATGTFTHFLNDGDGLFVGRITKVVANSRGEIWFVGERGLFHLNPTTGRIDRHGAAIRLAADYLHEDGAGDLWMLAFSPIVGLVKYDRQTGRFTKYPFGPGAVGVASSNLLADGENGFWFASSQGLQYFDRRTERYTYQFRHDETSPDSLDDDIVVTVYRDKAGLLWVGTETGGLNLLDWRQQQFGLYRHRPGDPNSLSPGKVTAIYQEPSGIVWVGFFPRALDRVDPRTRRVVHYVPGDGKNGLGSGGEVNGIYKDARGHLWLSGWAAGLDRLDERAGQFTHYRYSPRDPNGLMSDNVFRVQGSNSDGVWNEAGVSLPILVMPPWWRTNWFRATAVGLFLALLWAAHQYRVRQLQHAFDMTLEARVGERTRIARELHDTLLQSFHGLLLRFQTALYLLPDRPEEAGQKLSGAIEQAAKAITEGRNAVQGLRASTVERNDLALTIKTLGDELATDANAHPPPAFRVAVEGQARDLRPILRDEIYKIAAEALRNSFRHAQAGRIEVEIRYDSEDFRLRVRDDGKGIDQAVLVAQGIEGHYGLRGMPERAAAIGGKLAVWSEVGAGTEVELRLPARTVYATSARRTWWSRLFASKTSA